VGDPSCPVTGDAFDLKVLPAGTGSLDAMGATADFTAVLTARVPGVQGWYFIVALEPDPQASALITETRLGEGVLTANDGGIVDFFVTNYWGPAGEPLPGCDSVVCTDVEADAVSQAAVIDFLAQVTLPVTEELPLLEFTVAGEAPGIDPREYAEVRIVFLDAIGDPPSHSAIVYQGEAFDAGLRAPAVMRLRNFGTCSGVPEDFDLAILPNDPGPSVPASGGTADLAVALSARVPGVQGWSYGVILESDPGVEAAITKITIGDGVLTAKNGQPADFSSVGYFEDAEPGVDGQLCSFDETGICEDIRVAGIFQAVIVDYMDQSTLSVVSDLRLLELAVHAGAPALAAGESAAVRVAFTDGLGSPPVDVVVTECGKSHTPDVLAPTVMTIESGGATMFVPGSANGDGDLDFADAIYVLLFLFEEGAAPPCALAADANADCIINVSDAVFILRYNFLGGPEPPRGVGCQVVDPAACPGLSCDQSVEPGCTAP
jgi:hypothetical protein